MAGGRQSGVLLGRDSKLSRTTNSSAQLFRGTEIDSVANPGLERLRGSQLLNLRGQVFGLLTVIRILPYRHKSKRMWLCKCSCGSDPIAVRHDYLLHTNNPKTHCGCSNKGLPTLYPREYHIWNSMLRRCFNPAFDGYPQYGGRGITVCERWQGLEKDGGDGFANFFADMGRRPSPKHSLDRREANGNYEKDNCRWATLQEQARNKRNSVYLPHPQTGATVPAAEVAEFLGIRYQSMRARYIKEGKWPGAGKDGVN